MKIVIAPNALKGSLSAVDAAHAMAEGAARACAECETVLCPVADGGDGLVDVLAETLNGDLVRERVSGPLGDSVDAAWLLVEESQTAAIEMAAASGLALVPAERRDALAASTRGTGQLIAAALARGVKRVVVGVGGSATTDCGAGMAAALGASFIDDRGGEVEPSGGTLADIRQIDLSRFDTRLRDTEVDVLCDVTNPLLGPEGAAQVYSPQKGADPQQVRQLEEGLAHFAELLADRIGIDVRPLEGGGAAGGLAAGLVAFCGARLKPGAKTVIELTRIVEELGDASLVMTAEGKLDGQTSSGKAPAAVAQAARTAGVPCIALAGSVEASAAALEEMGFADAIGISDASMDLSYAMANARRLLVSASEKAVRTFVEAKE